SQGYWVLDRRDAGDGPCFSFVSSHDSGIQLMVTVMSINGPFAGIKAWVIFQVVDDRLHGIQRRTSFTQDILANRKGFIYIVLVGFLYRIGLIFGNSSCTTVNNQRPLFLGGVLLGHFCTVVCFGLSTSGH